jgi:uncharacterized protein (DUF1697 family)
VFLRGVNVGGHKAFRPSALVRDLAPLDVESIGAAGTFVVRGETGQSEIRARFAKALPFEASVIVCAGRDVANLVKASPFADAPAGTESDQYVSVLELRPRKPPRIPFYAPEGKAWQVGLLGLQGRFVASVLRRIGKTFLYPNEVVERHFGVPATTRNWRTILKIESALAAATSRAASTEARASRPAERKARRKRSSSGIKRSAESRIPRRPARARRTSRGR